MQKPPLPFILILALPLLAATASLLWWLLRPVPPIQVGLITWMASGAVVGSSEMNAGDLFLEEYPDTRIRLVPVDDEWNPERTPRIIADAMARGVRFFVSTHPSHCAVASLPLFADGRALVINTASTSPALTGRDDFLLRITPDAEQEQRAIAREVAGWPGRRLLVLQDSGILAYTDPAFAAFSAALATLGHWQVVQRKLMISAFRPEDERALMAEPYDALYILAGNYQTAIGNLAQLFHALHPEAPILLTPWARSPAILDTLGEAIGHVVLSSQHPSRHTDPAIDDYFRRFRARFGYEPHAMTIEVRQALELLDRAFQQGHDTPEAVKRDLLAVPTHQTSLGPIAFDRSGDVTGDFHFLRDLDRELQ
ncbi:ABC transporter substrate-binding protein [Thiocystis minor]|uniref:ABC transporter substrate-binding protein n=1 Tax=Thiocystis minor TaxID=61597 RepID=UPI0019114C67|nr:ABC transporter substrate-binding protein [Thiocystis minor]MBK5965298.1 ABC transporter substrate-binding protein [Thiocystis minor]